jgi:isoamylase
LRDDGPERRRVPLNQLIRDASKAWHGVRLDHPDWSDDSHSLAFTVQAIGERILFHCIFNAYWEALLFELPPTGPDSERSWRRWIDTSLDAPDDIAPWTDAPLVGGCSYTAGPRSVVILVTEATIV